MKKIALSLMTLGLLQSTAALATDDEVAQLARWEGYRLAVSRVDTTATDIVWPEKP